MPSSKDIAQLTLALQLLSKKIQQRIELETGFASQNVQLRHLIHLLKFYDKVGEGMIRFPDFQEFVLRMNCMSGLLARDVEFLFFRHDNEVLGVIDYKEFAYQVYGVGPYPVLSLEQLQLLDLLRRSLVRQDAHRAIEFALSLKSCMRNGFVAINDCVNCADNAIGRMISQKNLIHLFDGFNVNRDDRVHIPTFLKSFQFGMSPDRKKFVRLLFETIDLFQVGYVTISQLRKYYFNDARAFSTLNFRGLSYASPSIDHILRYMLGEGEEAEVTFSVFLEYYSYLSMSIEDNDFFEFILRSSWNVGTEFEIMEKANNYPEPLLIDSLNSSSTASPGSIGSPTASASLWMSGSEHMKCPKRATQRRIIVTHSNGLDEAVDIIDEMGKTKLDESSIHKALFARGVRDIVKIKY